MDAVRPVPRASPRSAGFKIPQRIVMPLLLQNRSNQAYQTVPKSGQEANGTRRINTEKESRHFLQPYPGVFLLAVAAAIARAQKRAALSTAVRA